MLKLVPQTQMSLSSNALVSKTVYSERAFTFSQSHKPKFSEIPIWSKIRAGKRRNILKNCIKDEKTYKQNNRQVSFEPIACICIDVLDRKSTRLNSSHVKISYA